MVKKDLVVTSLHMEETKNAKNVKNITLKELIDCAYQENSSPSYFLQILAYSINYFKNLTIVDWGIINSRLNYWNDF